MSGIGKERKKVHGTMKRTAVGFAAGLAAALLAAASAHAADTLKVTISHQSAWDAMPCLVAQDKGFFKEQNLDVSFINATGGTETVQTAATGSVHIVANASVHAAIAAYAKGANIRAFSSQVTGSPDIFWYVKAESPIRKIEDLDGKQVIYSRPNSVTDLLIRNLAKERKFTPKLIAGGDLAAVRTILMTGQGDAAWSGVPFAADILKKGEVRILFTGDDVAAARTVVSRVSLANGDFLKKNRDVVRRFQVATQKALDLIYGPKQDEAVQWFAKVNDMDVDAIRRIAPMFGTKEQRALTPIQNFAGAVAQAVEFGLIKEPLTDAQLKEFVDLVPPT